MELIPNKQRRPMLNWDSRDHGESYEALRAARERLIPHGCEFGTSGSGELTVRREDSLYTVYLRSLGGGRWWVGARPRQQKYCESCDEVVEFLRRWGFLREPGPDTP